MVKVNELRVGNLVFRDELNIENGKWDEVTIQINYQDIFNLINGNDMVKTAYNPIPLTEEWLVKLGFKKIGDEWRLYPSFEIQIIVFNDEKYNGVMFYTRTIHTDYTPIYCTNHINYVHQLQNLYFALTGQELETKGGANE